MDKKRAGDGTRTRDSLLGRQELYQLSYSRRVGVRGLEPRTSWSQTRRATNCATPRQHDILYHSTRALSSTFLAFSNPFGIFPFATCPKLTLPSRFYDDSEV